MMYLLFVCFAAKCELTPFGYLGRQVGELMPQAECFSLGAAYYRSETVHLATCIPIDAWSGA